MLRLTALLCAFMFVTMLVGGRDYGQMRPGLAAAKVTAAQVQVAATVAEEPVQQAPAPQGNVIAASFTATQAAETTSLSLPLVKPVARPEQAAAEPTPTADPASNVWYVDARSVNVREGPSTDYAVLGKLGRGEAITVLATDASGWARVVIEGDGIEGFVSIDYLVAENPAAN
ncbi:MAG: SH3 domain-containing protein [Paracoccaceae bacterium]